MRLYQAKKMDEATYTNNRHCAGYELCLIPFKRCSIAQILGIVLMKIAIESNELT